MSGEVNFLLLRNRVPNDMFHHYLWIEENSENSSCLKIRGDLEDRRLGKMKECDSVSDINSSSEMDIPRSPGSVKKIIET